MWRQCCKESEDDPSMISVKKSYFRNVLNTYYNIGFGSPQTDVFSTYLQLKEKIKAEKDRDMKNKLIISCDCRKNHAMLRIPDQAIYYSRQLYTYNFAAVTGSSDSKLSTVNVFAYT
ncbi:hypothetical protein HHI36_008654 [Cryptolaemus montrouzieri]|uniref:Uncharacterized protein n=1 Tax=Cryptolaemus montrouzieri TaxID=559131 RepID=A0ABD2MTL1_9CUCU